MGTRKSRKPLYRCGAPVLQRTAAYVSDYSSIVACKSHAVFDIRLSATGRQIGGGRFFSRRTGGPRYRRLPQSLRTAGSLGHATREHSTDREKAIAGE